jgi:hypothetical protein
MLLVAIPDAAMAALTKPAIFFLQHPLYWHLHELHEADYSIS